MASYLRPLNLEQALAGLAAGERVVVAGGTDYYPMRVGGSPNEAVLDISALDELRGITEAQDHYRIGALTTWTDLIDRHLLPLYFNGLRWAAREIGGAQIQNTGTLGGNVCNASPAADGVPNLLALKARVELRSVANTRLLALPDFLLGSRRTARRTDELLTALLVPKLGWDARSIFMKLGARTHLVISIVMVAGVLEPAADGTIADVRIAVGACNEVAQRLDALETVLRGQPLAAAADLARAEHLAALAPIDDIRASAAYRRDAALTLVRRVLAQLTVDHR